MKMKLMRFWVFTFLSLFSYVFTHAQNVELADKYFREANFEKAVSLYRDLYEKTPYNSTYYKRLLESLVELEKYDEAVEVVHKKMGLHKKNPVMLVDLGMIYSKKSDTLQARKYFDQALASITENPRYGFMIAQRFYNYHLLKDALQAYQTLVAAGKGRNYGYQISAIYGELGDTEKMFESYLDIAQESPGSLKRVQLYLNRFITRNPDEENNTLLRKALLRRLRAEPSDVWNRMLAWLYVQEHEYHKAFVQLKAVFMRHDSGLQDLFDLGILAFDAKDYDTSGEVFRFVIDHTKNTDLKINAGYYLLLGERESRRLSPGEMRAAFEQYFEKYGKGSETYLARLAYVDFLIFDMNKPEEAKAELEELKSLPLSPYDTSQVEMKLADLLVFTGDYNRALVLYSRIQLDYQNHPIGQEARFKAARTSYFRGDFKWANIQLKVLKRGTANLISNDAIDLSLLIDDNFGEDSIPYALRMYAQADLLKYRNKHRSARDTLNKLLRLYKGNPIEDEALFMHAQIAEKQQDYTVAEEDYQMIIRYHADDILIDDALYHLALLYEEKINMPQKAMEYYERIITEQPSSIYLIEARHRYRKLRGDELEE